MQNIKKARVLFVISSVVFISIMLGLIIYFSYQKSYAHMIKRSDERLEEILKNEGKSDGSDHFFIVKIDKDHKIESVNFVNISKNVSDKLSSYIKVAMSSEAEKGTVDGYRYMYRRDKRSRSVTIVFLSMTGNESMLKQNVKALVQFSLIGIGVVTIILIFVSKLVVWPIEEGERRQKEFISAASHSLKTPLTIISTSADLLMEESGENEWIDIIKEQSKDMTQMTNNLVLLTKLEEQPKHVKKIDFPISDVVCEIMKAFTPIAQNRHQQVTESIGKDISYNGNENDIRQLITLLLDNAHKYAGDGGDINVELKAWKKEVIFIVKNSSVQYDKKQLDKIFDRFYRGSSVKEGGHGIGLYVAKTIVKKHRGSIKAYMEDGEHIVFYVILK